MFKQFLLATFFSILASHVASASQETSSGNPCNDAMTTAQMRECENSRYERSDSELNQVYTELMSRLNESRQAKLKAAQRAWIQFRDKNTEFMASDFEGGSMGPLISIYWLNLMTEHRLSELREMLQETPVE
jgi:uncharacterized protein YecT (DUF1311 family)